MARMTVREIRQSWPEAERRLALDGEVIVTRDSRPVARILPYREVGRGRRSRFRADHHLRWLRRFWKGRTAGPSTDELLRRDRDE
jgi:antitoxin (DNA-binding transcriptional repressor) of toxin-antitoxin stability system